MIEELENKNPVSMESPISEIEDRILKETDINELQDVINLFNLNIQKKNIVRISKLTNIQDLITQQMEERVRKRADEFNNQDLLNYFKTIQETISKSDKTLDSVDTPAIQVTQNQLNINMKEDSLDRDSRERIMDAVKSILDKLDNNESLNTTTSEVIEVDGTQTE